MSERTGFAAIAVAAVAFFVLFFAGAVHVEHGHSSIFAQGSD
jgi:hypothetical protein